MPWLVILHCFLAFLLAFFIGTLVEYVVHRLMHARIFLYKIHAQHHQLGQGQGWFWEFRDYFLPSLPPPARLLAKRFRCDQANMTLSHGLSCKSHKERNGH